VKKSQHAVPAQSSRCRACWQYLRGNAYERRIGLALFRLDILIFGHLAQELLKLATAFGADLALQLRERFIYRLWLSE
jgi:hypothetical protein